MKKKGLSKMEKKEIAKQAEELLIKFGYNIESVTYVDITKLATSAGFRVGESKKIPFIRDGFMDRENLIIGVNFDRTMEEKRFIVAHELAHYYLESQGTVRHRDHVKGKDERENEADYFAACILMPQHSFVRHYNRLKELGLGIVDIIDNLQAIFKTPRESIKRRIGEVC